MFRGGNPLLRATKPMRQTVSNAVKVLVLPRAGPLPGGRDDGGGDRRERPGLRAAAWGTVPPQLILGVNEMLLSELERVRAAGEADPAFHERIVRDNIETVLAMEVPTRLERTRRQWEEIGEQVAPAAARRAQRAIRRAEDLSALVPPAVWQTLRQSVERGDAEALGRRWKRSADDLETNLRLRLDAKPEYREPASELRITGGPDPAFVEARAVLLRQDSHALDLFNDIHYRRSRNTIAKEWYAYALSLFGRATDIHDIIELLEEAIASEHYRPDRGWTARWNLACALRRLPSRAAEALDVLLPALEHDAHTAEVFECCLLWALEQNRQDVLGGLFLRARYHEAHLLAALQDVEAPAGGALAGGAGRVPRPLPADQPDPPGPRPRLPRPQGAPDLRRAGPAHARLHRELARRGGHRVVPAAGRLRDRGPRLQELGVRGGPERGGRRSRGRLALSPAELAGHAAQEERRSAEEGPGPPVAAGLGAPLRLPGGRHPGPQADLAGHQPVRGRRAHVGGAPGPRVGARAPDVEPATRETDERRRRPAPAAAPSDGPAVRAAGRPSGRPARDRRALALMLDWENIKISLADRLAEMPAERAHALRPRLTGAELAGRLRDEAGRHGLPRHRWAVADWDRASFEGDQKAVKLAGYSSDIAGDDKFNSSDHVLREKIHLVLREHPEVGVFIIGTGDGDFHEAIRTLQLQGKQVILWATRRAVNGVYGTSLSGPDRIRIEWLEDLVFGSDGTG